MSNNRAIRRKISYAPIIVTSKSIRSLDYQKIDLVINDKELNNAKPNREKLPAFLTRKTNLQSRLTIQEEVREPAAVETLSPPQESKQQNIAQMFKRIRNPPTVKVDFPNQTLKKRKLEMKVLNLGSAESEPPHAEKSGVTYFSNIKTFEQFSKLTKINPVKRSSNEVRDQIEEEWKKYLDKYHLNINSIKPILKRINDASLPPFKIIQIESSLQKPTKTKKSLIFQALQSDRHMRSFTKRQTSRRRDGTLISPSEKGLTFAKNKELDEDTLYKKIQQDIANSRSKGNKKDYFVFGLSQMPATSPEAILKAKFDSYKDFIFRINFTNGLYVKHRDEGDRNLKIFVGFGNNSPLVQGIMRRRFWWQTVDKITEDVNFVWTQLKISELFKAQPHSRPKLRHQKQKSSIAQSDFAIEEDSNDNDFNKSIMYGQNMLLWKRYSEKYSKHQEKGLDFGLPKRVNGLLKKKAVTFVENSPKLKMHNHLQCNYFLGNKKALFYTMKKYYELLNIPPFTKIPLTFHITQGMQDQEFLKFLEEFQKQKLNKNTDKDFRNVWIIKPGELTNRGRGITVCSTLDEIKNRIKAKQRNSNGTVRSYILQKYLQKPLLYQNRKFDIRHYMMMTCHNGQIKGYWYQEGYIRTTSSEYNIKNTKDLMNHLTNDAVQKNGQNYGKYQVGNKVSYADFQKYLINHVSANVDFSQQILPKMKQLATESIRATYTMLDPERKQHNFQLFGLDFMLDETLNVYLIEVNTNPCLETSCPLLTKIITPLVENVFKIGLDPLFPPPFDWPIQKKYLLGNNAFQQNKFALVFDELQEGAELKELYKNSERLDERMGDIFEEEEQYQEEEKEWDEQEQTKKQK